MNREEIYIRDIGKYPNFISEERVMKHIPLIWYMFNDRKVYIMTMRINNRTTKSGIESIKFMNERYVFKQLDLTLQQTQKREIFYIIRTRSGGELDISNEDKFGEANIDRYCQELNNYLGYKYWVYARDYLNVKARAIITVYDTGMNPFVLTDEPSKDYPNGTIERFIKTPFFLIISEKDETMRAIMEELGNLGYMKGYYGIVLGKNATSYAIKLLIELSEVRNFHTYILHDQDNSGLKIFLNMRRWIKAESIGVNPDFLEYCEIDNKDVDEDYNVSNTEIKGFIKIIDDCNLNRKEKYQYMGWMWACLKKRIELNSVSAYRLEQDLTESKVRDFCNYLLSKIGDVNRKWNLNRYREPTYQEPTIREPFISSSDFMKDIEKDLDKKIWHIKDKLDEIREEMFRGRENIQDKMYEGINKFLDDEDLVYSSDWKKLIQDEYNEVVKTIQNVHNRQCDITKLVNLNFMRINKRYKGDIALKDPDTIISKQEQRSVRLQTILSNNIDDITRGFKVRCKRLIKRTERFKDFREKLTKNEDNITKSELTDYLTKLRDYTMRELDSLIFIIRLDSILKRLRKVIRG